MGRRISGGPGKLGAIAELAPSLTDPQRLDGYASANASYQTALAIDPAHANASRRAGNLAAKLDRFDEAEPDKECALNALAEIG